MIQLIQMAKEQFNLRLEKSLMDKIREQARVQGVSITEWMENACLKELGFLEDPQGVVETWRGMDRLTKLEYDVKAMKENLQVIASRLDNRVDGVWDSIDYISAQLDAVKEQNEINKHEYNQENKIALRRLQEVISELESQGLDNPLQEAMRQVQEEMENF